MTAGAIGNKIHTRNCNKKSMNVQTVFQHLDPHRVALDLKLPLHNSATYSYIPHPALAQQRIWLVGNEFVSLNPGCEFVAGDAFDFLAYRLGGYEQAVQYVMTTYGAALEAQTRKALEPDLPANVVQLSLRRLRFMSLLALKHNLTDNLQNYSEAANWMSRRDLDPIGCSNMLLIAKGSELSSRLSLIADCPDFLPYSTYVVLPFFRDYHTIAKLRIYDVQAQEQHELKLMPARHAFFGLHTVRPQSSDVRVTATDEQCLFHHCHTRRNGNFDSGTVSLDFDNNTKEPASRLRQGLFLATGDVDFRAAARSRGGFSEYAVASEMHALHSVSTPASSPWLNFAVAAFRDLYKQERAVTPVVSRLLDDLSLDREVLPVLVKWLTDNKRLDLVKRIKARPLPTACFDVAGKTLEPTANGYMYRTAKSDVAVHGTNFTLRLHSSVWFRDSGDLFHYGVMSGNGYDYDVRLTRVELSKPNKLLETLSASVLSQTNGQSNFRPVFYDATAKHCVMCSLSDQVNNYSSVEGLQNLGWDSNRSVFRTPAWTASVSGVVEEAGVGHPTVDALRHYRFAQLNRVLDYGQVSATVKGYIALLVTLQARLFFRKPCPVFTFSTSPAVTQLLHALFLAYGQTSPVDLNTNKRKAVSLVTSEISAIPVFGNLGAEGDSGNMTGYAVVVGTSGIEFSEVVDEGLFNQIYSLAHDVCSQVAAALIRDSKQLEGLVTGHSSSLTGCIDEGRRLVEACTPHTHFDVVASDMPNFYGMLAGIAAPTTVDYFCAATAGKSVRINFSKIEAFRRQDVHKELAARHPSATMFKKHYVLIAKSFLLPLLEQFYGTEVQLGVAEDSPETC